MPRLAADVIRGTTRMDRAGPHLREVDRIEAIRHALWESHVCIGQWAFCAFLAMLRKAVDLWSAGYRDEHGLTFDRSAGERDDVYWRLRKIADANPLYRASSHDIIDGLRLDANEAVHDPTVCAGGQAGSYDGAAIMAIRGPAERLHGLVVSLIATTTPKFTAYYSDKSRWRDKPPDVS